MTTTYEAHITFPNNLRRKVKRHAGSWKFSRMLGDPVLGAGKYCYLTTYADNLDRLRVFVDATAASLTLKGIKPLRLKIEEEIYDRKIGAVGNQPDE